MRLILWLSSIKKNKDVTWNEVENGERETLLKFQVVLSELQSQLKTL